MASCGDTDSILQKLQKIKKGKRVKVMILRYSVWPQLKPTSHDESKTFVFSLKQLKC